MNSLNPLGGRGGASPVGVVPSHGAAAPAPSVGVGSECLMPAVLGLSGRLMLRDL